MTSRRTWERGRGKKKTRGHAFLFGLSAKSNLLVRRQVLHGGRSLFRRQSCTKRSLMKEAATFQCQHQRAVHDASKTRWWFVRSFVCERFKKELFITSPKIPSLFCNFSRMRIKMRFLFVRSSIILISHCVPFILSLSFRLIRPFSLQPSSSTRFG